jgi:hypothetical protein
MISGTICTQPASTPVRLSKGIYQIPSSFFEASPPSALAYLLMGHNQPHQQMSKADKQIQTHQAIILLQATTIMDRQLIHPLRQVLLKENKIRTHADPGVGADAATPPDRNDCTILRENTHEITTPATDSSKGKCHLKALLHTTSSR